MFEHLNRPNIFFSGALWRIAYERFGANTTAYNRKKLGLQFIEESYLRSEEILESRLLHRVNVIYPEGHKEFHIELDTLLYAYGNICADSPRLKAEIIKTKLAFDVFLNATTQLDPAKGIEGTDRKTLVDIYLWGDYARTLYSRLRARKRELEIVSRAEDIFKNLSQDYMFTVQEIIKSKKTNLSESFYQKYEATYFEANLNTAIKFNIVKPHNKLPLEYMSFKDIRKAMTLMSEFAKKKLKEYQADFNDFDFADKEDTVNSIITIGQHLNQISIRESEQFNFSAFFTQWNTDPDFANIFAGQTYTTTAITIPSAPPAELDDMAFLHANAMGDFVGAPGGPGMENKHEQEEKMPDPSAPLASSEMKLVNVSPYNTHAVMQKLNNQQAIVGTISLPSNSQQDTPPSGIIRKVTPPSQLGGSGLFEHNASEEKVREKHHAADQRETPNAACCIIQ